jgi:hypothetical protein
MSIPLLSLSWKEGRIWDSWMIVHFLTGTSIGFGNFFLELPSMLLFIVSALAMILWEIIEIFSNVNEVAENRLIDVAIGLLGIYFASEIVLPRVDGIYSQILFYSSLVLLALFCYFGWNAYQKRISKK